MGLIFAALAGLLVGGLARFFFPGTQEMGLFKTMLLGLFGGFLAGVLGRLTGWYGPGQGAGIIASVLGAMLILFLLGKRNRVT
ncbi:MAG: GlsB/YeaQ/YmgE family stress response membrane protein [Gemmatimonadaceae bacterium]|nr:GlsB/YeaQ/YmgE family stress response membrane protein [Gemmatimonadaceae bacterium]